MDAGIEAIVDLAYEEPPATPPRELIYLRFPMIDGADNPPARIDLALSSLSNLLRQSTPTLVACSAGMSRSPAMGSAALAVVRSLPLAETVALVAGAGPCDISPALLMDLEAAIRRA